MLTQPGEAFREGGHVHVLRRIRCDTLPSTTRVLEGIVVREGPDDCSLELCYDQVLSNTLLPVVLVPAPSRKLPRVRRQTLV